MAALGSLVVKLALEYAHYTQGLNKADQEALKFAKNVQQHMDQAKAAVGEFVGGMVAGAASAAAAALSVGAAVEQLRASIDRMDEFSKLSQKIGVATDTLQELAHVATLSDVSLEGLATGFKKLSANMADAAGGSETAKAKFAAIGVSVTDSNGKLRDSNEVMADVADRFADMKDGAGKTALAIELFGKQGAELIPMLNGGGASFKQAAEEARKFGLVVSGEALKAAEAFNDNLTRLGKITEGTFNQFAESALPVLNIFTEAMVESASGTDSMNAAAQRLNKDGTLREWAIGAAKFIGFVVDAGQGVYRTFEIIGKTMGAAAAQVAMLMSGDLKGAAAIGKSWSEDVDNILNRELFSTKLNAKLAELKSTVAEAQANTQKVAPVIKSGGDGKEKEKLSDYQKTTLAINERIAALAAEEGQQGKLTEADKFAIKTLVELRDGKLKLSQSEKILLTGQLESLIVEGKRAESRKEQEKLDAELLKRRQDEIQAIYKTIEKTQEEVDNYGKLPSAITASTIAKLEALKTSYEVNEGTEDEIRHIDGLIEAHKRLAGLQGRKEQLDADKKAADEAYKEWKKTADKIEDALTDALMRGFESGKGFLKNLRDTAVNMFKTLILRPVIQGIVQPIVGSIMGGGPAGGAMGGIMQGASLINAGSSIWGAMSGGMASGMGGMIAGAGNWLGSATLAEFGAGMQGASLAAGVAGPTTAGAGGAMGAGSTFASAMPYLAAAMAIYSIIKSFDDSGTIHTGGAGQASKSGSQTIDARALGFMRIDTTKDAEKAASGIASAIVGMLDSTAETFGRTAGFSAATAFADDTSKDGAWGALRITRGDQTIVDWDANRQSRWAPREYADGEDGRRQYVQELSGSVRDALDAIGLPSWAQTMLDRLGDAPTIEEIGGTVAQINATQQAITNLGQSFSGFANLTDEAIGNLLESFGGADGLVAGVSFFSQNFLTPAEQMEPVIKAVGDRMSELGYSGVKTKDQFASLVKSIDLSSEAGQTLYAALMAVAPAFLQVANYSAQVTAAAPATGESLETAQARRALEIQIMRLSGNELGALAAERQTELNSMDASLRPLKERVWALQDAADADAKVTDARQKLNDAYARESEQLKSVKDKFEGFAKSLRAASDALLTGDLSTLSPEQKYAELKARFDRTYSLALSGDPAAMEALEGVSNEFLQASKAYYASSDQYARDFEKVREALGRAANAADSQASIAKSQLDALNRQVAGLITINDSVLSVEQAIQNLTTAVNAANAARAAAGLPPTSTGSASGVTSPLNQYGSHTGIGDSGYRLEGNTLYLPGGGRHTVNGPDGAQILTETYGLQSGPNGTLIRTRAKGGYTPAGLTLVGEEGPELVDFNKSSTIYTAEQTRRLLSGGDAGAADAKLDTIIVELQAANRQRGAAAVAQMTKLEEVAAAVDSTNRQLARMEQ